MKLKDVLNKKIGKKEKTYHKHNKLMQKFEKSLSLQTFK